MSLAKFAVHTKERGLIWTMLFSIRAMTLGVRNRVVNPLLRWAERAMVRREMAHYLVGDATMSAHTFHEDYNRSFYDKYDWSKAGEEWTEDVGRYKNLEPEEWKRNLIDRMLKPNIPEGSTTLEIGPGGGRWTEVLQPVSGILHIADISERCLELCKERFKSCDNIQYHHISRGLGFIEDDSLDNIWSYDVFVHINPTEIDRYLKEFKRILKPGSIAVIHHAGNYRPDQAEQVVAAGRSPMNKGFFAHLVKQNGLELVEQNEELVHFKGDTITILRKS